MIIQCKREEIGIIQIYTSTVISYTKLKGNGLILKIFDCGSDKVELIFKSILQIYEILLRYMECEEYNLILTQYESYIITSILKHYAKELNSHKLGRLCRKILFKMEVNNGYKKDARSTKRIR